MNTMSTQLASSDAALVIKSSQNGINKQPKFVAKFAVNQEQILEAQSLRAKTFGQEYGVSFSDHPQGIDQDIYDDYYDNNTRELLCNRIIRKNDKIYKLKFIVKDMKDYTLYYKDEIIIGFSLIFEKISEIFH